MQVQIDSSSTPLLYQPHPSLSPPPNEFYSSTSSRQSNLQSYPAAPTSFPNGSLNNNISSISSVSSSLNLQGLPAPTPPMPMPLFSPSGLPSFSSDPKAHIISRMGPSPRYNNFTGGPSSPGSMGFTNLPISMTSSIPQNLNNCTLTNNGYFSTPSQPGFNSAQDYFSLSPGGSSLQFTTSNMTHGISSPRYPPPSFNQFDSSAPTSGTIMTSNNSSNNIGVTNNTCQSPHMAPISRPPSFYNSQYPFRSSPSEYPPPISSPNHAFTQAAYVRQMNAANLHLQPPPATISTPPRSYPLTVSTSMTNGTVTTSTNSASSSPHLVATGIKRNSSNEILDENMFKRTKWEMGSPSFQDFQYNPNNVTTFSFNGNPTNSAISSTTGWGIPAPITSIQSGNEYEDHKSAQILFSLSGNPYTNMNINSKKGYNNDMNMRGVGIGTTPITTTKPVNLSRGTNYPNIRQNKGLRHFSKQVCDKVECKGVTTYNEVADELASELAPHKQGTSKMDQKNVRRRVYDALNVLMAIGIIGKEKKEIRWKGLQYAVTNDQPPPPESSTEAQKRRSELEREVTIWRERTKRMWEQVSAAKQIVAVNKSKGNAKDDRNDHEPNAQLKIPFMLIATTDDSAKVSKEGTEVIAKASGDLKVIGWEEVAKHKVHNAQMEAQAEVLNGNNAALAAVAAAGIPVDPASIVAMQALQQNAIQQQAARLRDVPHEGIRLRDM